jgi:hypothetical protein
MLPSAHANDNSGASATLTVPTGLSAAAASTSSAAGGLTTKVALSAAAAAGARLGGDTHLAATASGPAPYRRLSSRVEREPRQRRRRRN